MNMRFTMNEAEDCRFVDESLAACQSERRVQPGTALCYPDGYVQVPGGRVGRWCFRWMFRTATARASNAHFSRPAVSVRPSH
jgi:hypothetical protein